jgi:hypothetical protein
VAGFLDHVLSGLRAEPPGLQLTVGMLAQRVLAEHAALERHGRHPAGGLVDRAQGGLQRRRLPGVRQQLHLHDDLHKGQS